MLRTICILTVGALLAGALRAAPVNLLPNGSFEFWSQVAVEVVPETLQGGRYDSDDPFVPTRWSVNPRGAALRRTSDAHGAKNALAVQGGALLRMSYLEVVPGAEYAFGVWAKGKGRVIARLLGAAPEGDQRLGEAAAELTDAWQLISKPVFIPGHIRFVSLQLETAAMDGALDDAHIAAELDEPYDADAVLRDKPQADAHTLLLADFETDDPAIKLGDRCRVVEGGRFGRFLRIEKPDPSMIPLKLDALPEEGTLEFWLSPDALPQLLKPPHPIHHYLSVDTAKGPLARFAADTSCTLRWSWDSGPKQQNSIAGPSEFSLRRMRKGQWTHVAAAWDAAVMRLFVDGALYAWTTQPPVKLAAAPSNLTVGAMYGHLAWNGGIDEIRLSSVNRFAPPLPRGAAPRPWPPAAPPAVAERPVEVSGLTPEEIALARKTLLRTLPPTQDGAFEQTPNADGDYVYEAARAKPLVDGALFEVQADKPAAGLTTVRIGKPGVHMIGTPVNGGACWTLGTIAPGTYYPGLLHESGGSARPRVFLYLNGRIVQTTGLSEPVQVAPGVWFAELRALQGVELKPGDELAAVTASGHKPAILRLMLHPRRPDVTAFRHGLHVGEDWWIGVDTALRLNVEVDFVDRDGRSLRPSRDHWLLEQLAASPDNFARNDEGRAVAHCRIANPLPVPVTVDYACTVKGYYGQLAGRDAERLVLQPHQRLLRQVAFDTTDDDPAYTLKATLALVGDERELRAGLGWPELDTLELLPGSRQSVPWPSVVTPWHGRRVTFTAPLEIPRWTRSLGGTWKMAFFDTLEPSPTPPPDSAWKDCAVPVPSRIALPQEPRRMFGAYFRRVFELPVDVPPQTYRLVVTDAAGKRTVLLNGTQVGVCRGSNTPLEMDVTGTLKPGTNELLIVVQDLLALMNPDYVNPNAPTPSVLYLDAPGMWDSRDQVWLHDVVLEGSPRVAAEGVVVETSVRRKTLAADFGVVNHDVRPVKILVRATVQDARQDVFALGERELDIQAGERASLRLQHEWSNPRLWSPLDPHLYVLAVEIVDRADGRRLDLTRQRFGFRESWAQGAELMLNGYAIKPKSLTTPNPYAIDLDFTLGRGATIPDYMSEFGYMATHFVGGLGNSSSKHNVDRDVFWETARDNALAGVRRMQNHACIIAWDLSNEWYGFLSYSGADPLKGAKRLRSVSDAVQRQDPTRWTFFNGDEDLDGLHDTFSGHYLNAYGRPYDDQYRMEFESFGRLEELGTGVRQGVTSYLPDGYFFRPLDRSFEKGRKVLVSPYRRATAIWGEKLLMNTEHLWKTGGLMPPGPSRIMGEENVLSPAVDHLSGPAAWHYKQNLDGHRDLECSVIAFYGGVCPSRRGYMLQQFIMPETVHHGYGGRTLRRDYSVHNDSFVPADLTLRWRLRDERDRVAARGEEKHRLPSAGVARGSLVFRLPAVEQRAQHTLELLLVGERGVVYGEERDIEVWPDVWPAPAAALSRPVWLFEPEAGVGSRDPGVGKAMGKDSSSLSTADALAAVGVTFERIAELAAFDTRHATPDTLLILAENALTASNAAGVAALGSFVERGGRVVILAQKVTPTGLPIATALEPRHHMSQLFVQTPDHPVLEGVSSWDLHFWAPARVSARGAYAKPESGPVTTLVNSGGQTGMEWMQLFECYRGRGLYLVCQLPLIGVANEEPMARELLAAVLAYAGSARSYRRASRSMAVVTAPNSPLANRLDEVGVVYKPSAAERPLGDGEVGLLDAADPRAGTAAAVWKPALLAGATVVVAGAAPADANWLSELAGVEVEITVQPYSLFEGRGYRDGFGRLSAGLTLLDLYFKNYDESEQGSFQAEDPKWVIEPFVDYSVRARGGREQVFPGALVELPVGRGRLLLDQRRWTTRHESLRKHAGRMASALALGLDVDVAPVVPLRPLPAGVVHRPVDLSAFVNRSLTDRLPDDGKDGWPDQGAGIDARGFPTGRQTFQGVPFHVLEGRNCVVLRNTQRPGAPGFPTDVTIPLGLPIEGFYVLHSSAYTPPDARVAVYQVQYEDGASVETPVVNGVNIHDWAGTDFSFAREKETHSNIAWTGSNEVFPRISVFRMLWVNPYPEKKVKAIRFANPEGRATVMLAGLTLALDKETAAAPPGDAAQALEWLTQAVKLADEGQLDAARQCLERAIEKDPLMSAAYQTLADLVERTGDEDAALDLYRRWAAAGADTPLPYNRIGEILEKREDDQGALESYDRSIEIEWNQPPILEAGRRVRQRIGKGSHQ